MRRPAGGRVPILAAAILVLVPGRGPAGAAAQEGPDSAARRVGCFTGRPLPRCASFWIFEIQAVLPVASRDRIAVGADGSRSSVATFGRELEWNVGHAVNLTPRVAVGAVLTAGTGSPEGLAGIKARIRYWFEPDWSVELEGGWIRSKAAGTAPEGVNGVTSDLRLNVSDRVSAFVRWDRLWLEPEPGFTDTGEGRADDALSAGIGLGSWPAVVGTGVVGLAFAVALGLFVSQAS